MTGRESYHLTMDLYGKSWVLLPLLLHLSVVEFVIGALSERFLEQTECHDKLGRDCFKFRDDQCIGKYTLWAKEHCALRCGYCPQKLPCVDQITYCDEYEERFCTDERYGEYMRENCRRTCDLCRVPTEYLTSSATVSTTVISSWCFDHAPSGSCWYYEDAQCIGIYESWARKYCPHRCGYCPGSLPPCEDAISYCGSFGQSLCAESSYAAYMRQNCRKTCKLCTYPGVSLTPNSFPNTSATPVAITDGKIPPTVVQ